MKFLISLILLCLTSICSAETLQGIVTYVYDGDTFMLEADNQHYRIRLASIDAPELDQPYGVEAAHLLRMLVYNKPIIAQVIDTDKYGRKVAKVYAPIIESAKASDPLADVILAKGYAWHYVSFDMFDEEYDLHMKLENSARDNKLGLWQEPRPTPPWVWRKKYKIGTLPPP